MPKLRKKGEAGNARNFITRTRAVKKLQLTLPDFRKLCIWKGIYPREPGNRKKASKSSTPSTTFYYTKDIQYLLHEPLLSKFRDQKILEKKITRALGCGNPSDAAKFERQHGRPDKTGRPRYSLDHVIRERYPTFIDALRDLDDCLSMLFLFANLPSTTSVPAKMVARCERLCMEFEHYLIVSRSLRKSFLSIKGIYYQANIQGEDILWVVPYKFNHRIMDEVDFRIMGTFVEFYMTLLGFVNHRLYTSIGLKYPPRFDQAKDEGAAELAAFTLEGVNLGFPAGDARDTANCEAEKRPDPALQAEINKLVKQLREDEAEDTSEPAETEGDSEKGDQEQLTDGLDKFEPAAPGGHVLPQPDYSSTDVNSLFANCSFFLSRETPRQPLEFLLRSFGCKRIGWDAVLGEGAFTTDELDPCITHQIVDRPIAQPIVSSADSKESEDNQTAQRVAGGSRVPDRIYVQPQWVWDSVNDAELKDPSLYAPGAQMPPHLSPFVKGTHGRYDPTMSLEAQETEAEALDAEIEEAKAHDGGGANDMEEEDAGSFGGFSGDEDDCDEDDEDQNEEEHAAQQRQRELEAEMAGKAVKDSSKPVDSRIKAKQDAKKALLKKQREEADDLERAKGMLSKKKRRLFEIMQSSNKKKSEVDEKLRAKRRKLENEVMTASN